jgi:hypothetical protein
MKTILVSILFASALAMGACSPSDKQDTATQTATPVPNLKADADRLQEATAKAAEERRRAELAQSPTPTVAQP